MTMEIPAKALLIIKGTPNRAMMPGMRNIQAIQRVLSGLPVTVGCVQSEIVRVQYNPSSLSIRAHAQNIKVSSIQKPEETTGVKQKGEPPSIELSVKLVFTTVDSKDTFMTDKLRLSASDAMSNGVAIAKAVSDGYTVHPQIDGLMGVIMDMDTRGVALAWQDMVFESQVSSPRSSYNMFSMSGNPISGSADMSVTQNISGASVTAQNKALDKCFISGMAGKNPLEKAGNLINLNLRRQKGWAT